MLIYAKVLHSTTTIVNVCVWGGGGKYRQVVVLRLDAFNDVFARSRTQDLSVVRSFSNTTPCSARDSPWIPNLQNIFTQLKELFTPDLARKCSFLFYQQPTGKEKKRKRMISSTEQLVDLQYYNTRWHNILHSVTVVLFAKFWTNEMHQTAALKDKKLMRE